MSQQHTDQFEEIFKSESLRGERIHWKISWVLYIIVFVLSSFVFFIQNNEAGKYGMILSSINLTYNLFISWFIYKKKSVVWVGYITIFLNVLTLTIYNFLDASYNSTIIPATSAALLIYPIIILLSALRMNKYLIIWTSLLCVIAMDGLYIWFYDLFDPHLLLSPISIDFLSQIYRTIYIIICGILIYFFPASIHRVLKKQEQLAKESTEHQKIAQIDSLTGLNNRMYFLPRLSACIHSAKITNHKLALFFIDLNRFKLLNDTYGHDFGDFILKSVAEDISSSIRENDLAARIGCDEFLVVISQISDIHEVKLFGHRFLSAITHQRSFKNIDFVIGASMGVSIYPDDTEDPGQLIKYADEAMYEVKRSGKEGFMFYNSIETSDKSEEKSL